MSKVATGAAVAASDAPPSISDAAWREAAAGMRERLGDEAFNEFFASVRPAAYTGNELTITTVTNFQKHWTERHYAADFAKILERVLGRPIAVRVTVRGCLLAEPIAEEDPPRVRRTIPPFERRVMPSEAPDNELPAARVGENSSSLGKKSRRQAREELRNYWDEPEFGAVTPIRADWDQQTVALHIQNAVAAAHGLTRKSMLSRSRAPHVVRVRNLAVLLITDRTSFRLDEIGRLFGCLTARNVRLIVKYLRLDAARHQDLKERIETLKTALASKNGGTVMPSRPIKHVQQVVAAYFGLSMSEMLGPNRTLRIVRPRQIAMFLAKTEGLHSFPEIGKVFGRDHTTILHAVRTIQELMETDRVVVHYVDELKRLISD